MLRNILAVLAGLVVGGVLNVLTILVGSNLIPPPDGVNVNDVESLRANIHLFEARHFITPFLAHALNAFGGALAAYLVAATHKHVFAYAIGILALCGGIAAAFMIPAPSWFLALDLVGAYLPMAWLAIQVGERLQARPMTAMTT